MTSSKSRFLISAPYIILGVVLSGVVLGNPAPAAAQAASVSGNLNIQATIVQPMTINCNTRSLNFGAIIPGASGGTVRVPPSGTTTYSGTLTKGVGTPASGQCSLTGASNASYMVELPTSVTLTNGSNQTMTVNNFIMSDGTTTGLSVYDSTLNNGSGVLSIGADLVVAAGQKAGNYTGILHVDVTYE